RGPAGRQTARRHELPKGGTASRFAVVVRTKAAGQESEAIVQRVEVQAKRVGTTRLEPAVAAGTRSREEDAGLPCLTQDLINAVLAPDRQCRCGVATADIDDVLGQEE